MREQYRAEMNCQIIHDSIHSRPGWTLEYIVEHGGAAAGYGSVAVAGPWKRKPALYEFYVQPHLRTRVFDLFAALLEACQVKAIETQTNARLLAVMLHTFARRSRRRRFCSRIASRPRSIRRVPFSVPLRQRIGRRCGRRGSMKGPDGWRLQTARSREPVECSITTTGPTAISILEQPAKRSARAACPNCDEGARAPCAGYMAVAESYRRKGLGAYLVQELKAVCRAGGSVPAARCNVKNLASRRTLQKAGFVPCGNLVAGSPLS